jgi:hypothetical protein
MATANDLNISAAGYVVFDGTAVFTGRTFQAGTGVTLTNASGVAGNTTIGLSGSVVGQTITGNSGVISPTAGNWNILTANSTIKFAGSGSTLTQDFGVSNLFMGGTYALTTGYASVGLGYQSSTSITTGYQNVAVGYQSLMSEQGGHLNVAIGNQALANQNGGNGNVGIGSGALLGGNTGGNCVAIGISALSTANTQGGQVAVGAGALQSEGTLGGNVAVGYNASTTQNGGQFNSSFGTYSLRYVTTGSYNVGLGYNSGSAYTSSETSNICIGNVGVISESNVLRIGTQGTGNGQQNTCFIAGIVGNTVSNQQVVTINSSTGQLGVSNTGTVWNDVTTATQTLAVNNGYITDHTDVTYTLPSTAALGDKIEIVGKLGIATITPNANQQILIGSASGTVGVTGTAVATNVGDCIKLRCITSGASSVWRADNFVGNWTLT